MLPDEFGESPRFLFHDLQPEPRTLDRRLDLGAAADDTFVLKQPGDLLLTEPGNPGRLEAGKRFTKIFALAQNGDPRQTRLKAIEYEFLVQRARIVFRNAPFRVVIRYIERVLRTVTRAFVFALVAFRAAAGLTAFVRRAGRARAFRGGACTVASILLPSGSRTKAP
jgi:hypothetical protein